MRGSVKQKLLIIISALILVSVLAVTVLTYSNYSADLVEQGTQNTQQLLLQLGINVDTYLDELFRLCLSPYYNKRVMEQLETTPTTAAEKLAKRRLIEDYLTEVMTLPRSDILRAHILSDEVYSSSKTRYSADIARDYQQESWYVKALQSNDATFLPAHTETQGKTTLSVFSIVQRINSTRDSGTALGVIRVDANYNGIKTVCDRAGTGEGSALYIVDSAGSEIYRDNRTGTTGILAAVMAELTQHAQETTFTFRYQNADYLVNIQSLHVTDWQIIDIHAMRSLTSAATQARNKAFLLAILCAMLGVLITIPLVKRFLKPIFQITDLMHVVQTGDLTMHASITGHDELAYLAHSFNDMVDQIHGEIEHNNLLTRQVYEARYLEKEAQYAALCNQIKPHFLFNALNTIHLLIKTNRGDEAVQCIDMLATLLRGMVNSDREITLRSEMKIVESYLMLQQKRYASLGFTLPDVSKWENYLLPALTIQPLVENALVHGCEPKRGRTQITLSVAETESELQIIVTDNGMGMNEATMARLRESLCAPTVEPSSGENGVGLVNITRRVKLKFGEPYGLTLTSVTGEGTTVTLHLPLEGGEACTAP
ncbi:MAG: sensor histidine kinase [Eubacteriales bacterium]|nr:sensor histidine kinase [Eubacteriales bacterium]